MLIAQNNEDKFLNRNIKNYPQLENVSYKL